MLLERMVGKSRFFLSDSFEVSELIKFQFETNMESVLQSQDAAVGDGSCSGLGSGIRQDSESESVFENELVMEGTEG